jgi:hypothetical protein
VPSTVTDTTADPQASTHSEPQTQSRSLRAEKIWESGTRTQFAARPACDFGVITDSSESYLYSYTVLVPLTEHVRAVPTAHVVTC